MSQNKELPPLMVELEKARVELKPFWELSKKIFGEDSKNYELLTAWYRQKSLASQAKFRMENPHIVPVLSILAESKRFWRMMHPKQDKHLQRFYGYSDVLMGSKVPAY
jgi:hypothetical protein